MQTAANSHNQNNAVDGGEATGMALASQDSKEKRRRSTSALQE